MVVAPLIATSLDALTEVGVFRVNRGVVLQLLHFPCFLFSNDVFVIVFLHYDIFFYFTYVFLCHGTFCFLFSYVTHRSRLTSHFMSHWSDSFNDSQIIVRVIGSH